MQINATDPSWKRCRVRVSLIIRRNFDSAGRGAEEGGGVVFDSNGRADLDAATPRVLAEQLYPGAPLMPRRISGGNTFVDVLAPQRIASSFDLSW